MSFLPPDVASASVLELPATALGSRASRVAALLLDSAIIAIPILMLDALLGSHSGPAVAGVLWVLATLLYNPLLLARSGERNGQTIGKQLLSLRVVTTSGIPVTLGVGFKRHLLGQTLPSAFTFGLYSLLDYSWPLWDERKQALHDKIGDTYVFTSSANPTLARDLGATVAAFPAMAPPSAPPPPPPPPPATARHS